MLLDAPATELHTTKSRQLRPPEEVAQRRHYLPLLGMILLALLFKASPTVVLMA